MIEALNQLDTQLFFFLNGHHHPFWDNFMFLVSEREVWYPLYLGLITGLIWRFKKVSWVLILSAVLAVGASDFVTSGIMKPAFERYRPSRNEMIMDKVHIVNDYRGGRYGFASSHAANTFAIATFFFMIWRTNRWAGLLFVWAVIVSYSRIYLGVHYPGDILVGGLIGAFFGWILYRASKKLIESKFPEAYNTYF